MLKISLKEEGNKNSKNEVFFIMNSIAVSIIGLAQFFFLQSALATPTTENQLTPPNQANSSTQPEHKAEKLQLAYKNAHDNSLEQRSWVEQERLADALRSPSITEIQSGALLRLGHKGPAIKEIKALFNVLGYTVSDHDLFDQETMQIVGQFQEKNRLVQRNSSYWGVIGSETLEKLQNEAKKSNYSERIGRNLVKYSRSHVIGTERYCYRFVANAIETVTTPFLKGQHAYMASEHLAKSEYFREIFPKVDGLEKLPAGAIVVWGKGKSRSGHISIADGQGNEISDHIRPQMLSHYGGAQFRVFLPVEPQNSKQ
jgi:hypothetical protein